MNYFAGLKRRLRGKDRWWWNYFHVHFDDQQFHVVERRVFGRDKESAALWRDVRAVCFEDGGLASDAIFIHTNSTLGGKPILVPTESEGGNAFFEELQRLGLFPQSVFEQAVTSASRGRQIWWPPLR
jgi:hypothetical protein